MSQLSHIDYRVLESTLPWKTVTVMAWVHGNEKSGIVILEELADTLQIVQWKVHLILRANPHAISANKRHTEKNMNRAFHDIPEWSSYEDLRAQELIPILQESDLLLDVHNTLNTENSIPFLISEHLEWNKYFPVDRAVGWLDILHPGGSDGYMNSIGNKWLCIEAWSIHFDDQWALARKAIMNFLRATGNIAWPTEVYSGQEYYILDRIIKAKTSNFRFIKPWLDFEKVTEWELIAHDDGESIYAPCDGVIVFRHETRNIGDEMCVFGQLK